jgi:phosphoenolpyruvate carboxykinase (ATP)
MAMPASCPGVPAELLNPRNTWPSLTAYDEMAGHLADWFTTNFQKYAEEIPSSEIRAAAPVRPGSRNIRP